MTAVIVNGWAAKWTDNEDRFLRENYALRGAKWCALQLTNRSEQACRSRAYRLGVKLTLKNSTHHKLTEINELDIVRLYTSGLSAQEIIAALQLKVCLDVIYDTLRHRGITPDVTGTRNRRWSDDDEKKIADLYLAGNDTIKLARLFRTSQSAINLVLTRCGVQLRHAAFGGGSKLDFTDKLGRSFKMRSSWEIGTASWLDEQNKKWDYELETFNVIVGTKVRKYTPDFWIYDTESTILIDVKGVRNENQMDKIRLLSEQRPDLKIEIWDYWKLKQLGILPSSSP